MSAAATVGSARKEKKRSHNSPVNEKVRRCNIIWDWPSAAEANCARHLLINEEKKPTKRFNAVRVGGAMGCRSSAMSRKQLWTDAASVCEIDTSESWRGRGRMLNV